MYVRGQLSLEELDAADRARCEKKQQFVDMAVAYGFTEMQGEFMWEWMEVKN